MAYQVLARKYRPELFSDVIGQDHVTRTLLNALSQNRIAHGYIFSGHRGIGKTTIARILASALNCRSEIGSAIRPTPEPCNACESCLEIRQGNAVDVIEIDAATNRGIDEIRELRDAARYRPSRDKYKIYILDEAHQITDAAFNALLKTLEEPPDHIVFMMATTQPEDIPQTIRSRCQHFSFHAVKLDDIVGQLRLISTAEEIVTEDATLSLLAEAGDGSMRDALSIMDQAIASAPLVDGHPALDIAQVRELMGSVSNVVYENILHAVHANNSADVLAIVARLLDAGNGAPQLARQFVRYIRNVLVAKITRLDPNAEATGVAADLLQISPEERQRAARTAILFTEEELSRFLAIMLRTFDELGYRQEQRFHLELGLLKLVHVQRLLPVEDILSQLGAKPTSTPTRIASVLSTPEALGIKSSAAAAPARISTPVAASAPSPFAADRSRKTPVASASTFEPSQPSTLGSMALAPDRVPESKPEPLPTSSAAHTITPVPEPAPDRPHLVPPAAPITAPISREDVIDISAVADTPTSSTDVSALHAACVSALAAVKGQQSASEQIEDSTFNLSGDTLNIQTTLSKTMLPVVLNGESERILKTTVRPSGILKINFLPGTPAPTNSAPKKPRAAASGSAAELAEKHPIVQEARRLFAAEISNVIDLRGKS
jgi:DNA polymerase-3 subunit gamma/tau